MAARKNSGAAAHGARRAVPATRSHLDRIRDKTSCRRRADLTRLALREGLL